MELGGVEQLASSPFLHEANACLAIGFMVVGAHVVLLLVIYAISKFFSRR